MNTIGSNVKRLRLALNLTQHAAAIACQMSDSQYGQYELDHVTPGVGALILLSNGMGIAPTDLLAGIAPPARRMKQQPPTGDEPAPTGGTAAKEN